MSKEEKVIEVEGLAVDHVLFITDEIKDEDENEDKQELNAVICIYCAELHNVLYCHVLKSDISLLDFKHKGYKVLKIVGFFHEIDQKTSEIFVMVFYEVNDLETITFKGITATTKTIKLYKANIDKSESFEQLLKEAGEEIEEMEKT